MVIKTVNSYVNPKYQNLKDNYDIKLLDGDFKFNNVITVELNGNVYKRKVHWDNDDLYITINGYKYFPSDVI